MKEIDINIAIPELWGNLIFKKNNWGNINLIVGANGTGKSLFADKLKNQLISQGYKPRLLNAERLSGLEKQKYSGFTSSGLFLPLEKGIDLSKTDELKKNGEDYGLSTSAFVILKERLDIRIRIEAFLSDIFKKTIRLKEEGGYLIPKIQNISGETEYNLKEKECHGLKELISLLTFLYEDSNECLILDEPELHLHPQFQSFFLNEIKRLAGDPKQFPNKKLFFLITHSPYFIDLKTLDDLKNVIVFKNKHIPSYINSIDGQDEYIIKKFLPRFNTHHKQFFFSENPVFVEGYTDQQVITILYEKLGRNISASGSSIIDVGGKDELGVFFKLCSRLGMKPIIIADLDALFKGKLRECLCENELVNNYIQEKGIGENLSNEIGNLEVKLKMIAENLISKKSDIPEIKQLIEHLCSFIVEDKNTNVEEFRYSMLLGIIRYKSLIESVIDNDKKAILNLIPARLNILIQAGKECNINLIQIGELEHFYTQSDINYLKIINKDQTFHKERDFLLSCDIGEIIQKYPTLIYLLEEIIPSVTVNLSEHLKFILIEWIQNIQSALIRGEVETLEQLKVNARINYALFKQILEVTSFIYDKTNRKFNCKIRLSNNLIEGTNEIVVNEETTAFNFVL